VECRIGWVGSIAGRYGGFSAEQSGAVQFFLLKCLTVCFYVENMMVIPPMTMEIDI